MQLRRPLPCSHNRNTAVSFLPAAPPLMLIHLPFFSPTRDALRSGNTRQRPESQDALHNLLLCTLVQVDLCRRFEGTLNKCRGLWGNNEPEGRHLLGAPSRCSNECRAFFASRLILRPSCAAATCLSHTLPLCSQNSKKTHVSVKTMVKVLC